ncbi:Retrotransposon gag domain [Lasallia pustulata]|uniref:Retrotransposon gag domain n=1 Tax=Lasallia pustulata TaxID=136370 RepID=A0A1W5D7K9_9LECA|nr:Retrotransposon gag domain [Lasallia pustulata]
MVREETNELKHSTRAITRLTSPSKQDPGGSKIPQPKSLTLRLPFRPRSVQPEHPTPSPPISRNPEPSNPISATSSSNPTIPVFVRMGHATIKPFSGQRDGKEDPGKYLEDIEFAYINDYAGSPATAKEDDHKSKTSKILFQQHLREGAATWYGDLPKDTKNNWEKLRKEFEAEFKFEDNHKTETFILWQRVSSLSQGEDEPIVAYIRRADDLARKLPAALATLRFNVVRGMKDDTQRCRVTFECAKEQDYDFQKVKKFIVAAYQVIGQNGPFETTQEGTTGSSGAAKGSTLTGEDWINRSYHPSSKGCVHSPPNRKLS